MLDLHLAMYFSAVLSEKNMEARMNLSESSIGPLWHSYHIIVFDGIPSYRFVIIL